MPKESYNFKLGSFECLVIRDTISPLELDTLFSNLKVGQMEPLLRNYNIPAGDIFEVMCLLAKTVEHNVLIDTGWGVGEQPNSGRLMPILRANKVQPEKIDTVIISHGHPDHIGGNTDDKCQPLFPNACYVMLRKEWDFWTSMPELPQTEASVKQKMLSHVRKNLIPIRDHFAMIDYETEIVPGIRFVDAPGHSPYHCMLNISSGAEQLIYVSDIIHHQLQIVRSDYCVFADFDSEQARRTRAEAIPWIASNNLLVFACHFPFPGLGHIIKKVNLYDWQPVEIKNS